MLRWRSGQGLQFPRGNAGPLSNRPPKQDGGQKPHQDTQRAPSRIFHVGPTASLRSEMANRMRKKSRGAGLGPEPKPSRSLQSSGGRAQSQTLPGPCRA